MPTFVEIRTDTGETLGFVTCDTPQEAIDVARFDLPGVPLEAIERSTSRRRR